MKFGRIFSTVALSSMVYGRHVHNNHEVNEKRDVTVIVTQLVNENGQIYAATNKPETTTASSVETTSAQTTTLTPSTTFNDASSSSSSTSSSSSSTSSSSGEYGGSGGITYSPYTNSGSCKTSSEIQSDIEFLSQFDIIRIYDTDCEAMSAILSAMGSDQKLMVGIYYIDDIASSVSLIESAFDGDYSQLYAVSVGNELVNSGDNTPAEILTAVESARTQLTAIGYTGDVVTVDTLVAVEDNTSMCSIGDFLAVNSHPYWDGNVDPEDCGTWLQTQIENLSNTCGSDKTILITETGWPTEGSTYGTCVPSKTNQETCINSIIETLGSQVILFTTYNDYWKSAGTYGVEQYWGIFGDSSE